MKLIIEVFAMAHRRSGTSALSNPDARRTDRAAPYEKVLPDSAAASPVRRCGYRARRHSAAGGDGRHRRCLRACEIQNELGLSDTMRNWVISAYVLTFGGLMLLGGRLGDTIGQSAP